MMHAMNIVNFIHAKSIMMCIHAMSVMNVLHAINIMISVHAMYIMSLMSTYNIAYKRFKDNFEHIVCYK